MAEYVIVKNSRLPRHESYSGPSWETGNIADRYRKTYADKQEAEELAKVLSKVNPIGFYVAEATENYDDVSKISYV